MYKRIKKLISVTKVKAELPSGDLKTQKFAFDNKIKDVICKNGKFMLIIGPCSADNHDAVLSYCEKLRRVEENVKDLMFFVPRIYTTKPRSALGAYRGMLHSPTGNAPDFNNGILSARKLMLDVARDFGYFAADEMLYPELYPYFDDVLSYITVGARSSEDQLHRLFASCPDVAVGIKNPMNGDLTALAQAVKIATSANDFAYGGYEISSSGNKFAHAILRGYTDRDGKMHSNFERENIERYAAECAALNINDAVIIDCNHGNSGKNAQKEPLIAAIAVDSLDINKQIKGLMIESYLFDGKQDTPVRYGVSLTDDCLGVEKTEKAIYDVAERLAKRR